MPLEASPREQLERLAVAVRRPCPARSPRQRSRITDSAAPLLALVDRRQVHLDRRQAGHLERVADRLGVVRPRARVEDQPGRRSRLVQLLAELALVVRLEERHGQARARRAKLLDLHLELGRA